MPRLEPVDPEMDEHGWEVHPSFGTASVHRVQSTGTTLFDSELRHREFVVLRVDPANLPEIPELMEEDK